MVGNALESSDVGTAMIVAAVVTVITVMLLFVGDSSNAIPTPTTSAPPAAEAAP